MRPLPEDTNMENPPAGRVDENGMIVVRGEDTVWSVLSEVSVWGCSFVFVWYVPFHLG